MYEVLVLSGACYTCTYIHLGFWLIWPTGELGLLIWLTDELVNGLHCQHLASALLLFVYNAPGHIVDGSEFLCCIIPQLIHIK